MTRTSRNPFPPSTIVATAAIALALLTAPTSSAQSKKKGAEAATTTPPKVVFPTAPDPPVIEWVASYAKRSDVAPTTSSRKKRLRRILVGEEPQDESGPALVAPTAIALGADETVYVVDQQLNHLVLINADEKRFEVFAGEGAGRLGNPVGVAVADDGTLFVSDSTSKTVYVYSAALEFLRALGSRDLFERPTGLALSPDGKRLAVCDTARHQVLILDPESGRVLTTLGGEGSGNADGWFHFPWTVTYDSEGFLYVTDYLNFRVQVFDSAGDHDLSFGQAGDSPGDMARPRGIAVDAEAGVIYVVDGAYQVVQMFNLDAEILMFFGGPGSGPAQLSLPSGIALRGDLLAVADTLNHRVQLFRFLGVPSGNG